MSSETRSTRYWCHICSAEVSIYMAPDPTCQRCNEQFIEELQTDDDPREFLNNGNNNNDNNRNFNMSDLSSAQIFTYSPSTGRLNSLNNNNSNNEEDLFRFLTSRSTNSNEQQQQQQQQEDGNGGGEERGNDNASPLNNLIQNLVNDMLGQNIDLNATNNQQNTDGQNNRPMVFFGNLVDGNISFQPVPNSTSFTTTTTTTTTTTNSDGNTTTTTTTNNNEGGETENTNTPRGNNIASLLQFISAMTGSPLDGGIVGNPNDYVFSQNALDNIITQLMEQTGGASAPPPAPEDVIDALVKRHLNDKEKSQETDCAVCKDQFEVNEQVIELPCEHIFHDDCIKPWLKLNSTCPVCRHSVLTETQNEETNENTERSISTENNANNDSDMDENTSTTNTNTNTTTNTNATADNIGSVFSNISNPPVTTFTWFGGTNPQQTGQTGQGMPLSLSSVFPWVNSLVNEIQTRNNNQQQNADNNNNDNSSVDDDLELD